MVRQLSKLKDVNKENMWISTIVKVDEVINYSENRSVSQVGIFGDAYDETVKMPFIIYRVSNLQLLVKDKMYRLENIVSDKYYDKFILRLNRITTITGVAKIHKKESSALVKYPPKELLESRELGNKNRNVKPNLIYNKIIYDTIKSPSERVPNKLSDNRPILESSKEDISSIDHNERVMIETDLDRLLKKKWRF
jgi:hypothetical protein